MRARAGRRDRGFKYALVAPSIFVLLLIGVFPLFYGARKVLYAEMGLGLVEDEAPPRQPSGNA